MASFTTRLGTLAVLAALATSCAKDTQNVPATPTAAAVTQDATRDGHLALGNPSGAVADPYYYWNYLLTKPQFVMSYHRDRGVPNWVSWHLSSAWKGSATRSTSFYTDATLPTVSKPSAPRRRIFLVPERRAPSGAWSPRTDFTTSSTVSAAMWR